MSRCVIFILTILYTVLITLLSTLDLSDSTPKIELEYFDKIVHFCFYFGMNTLLLICGMYRKSSRWFATATIISILYGVLMEIIQQYVGRDFDIYDIIANSCGAVVALLLITRAWVRSIINIYIVKK